MKSGNEIFFLLKIIWRDKINVAVPPKTVSMPRPVGGIGIEVGKVVKGLNSVYVEPFAKISDSIYVNVLAFDFEKLIEW